MKRLHNCDRRELAAALRWAVRLGLHEGIDNHFSSLTGDGNILINPFGLHWSEISASSLLLLDGEGVVLEGAGEVEPTAGVIHRAVHEHRPDATAVLHTHMPYATAIGCLEHGRLEPIHQNAVRFFDRIAYDDDFAGLALTEDEGDRIARMLGNKQVLFLANHGVVVVGGSVAEAFDALYFLERAAKLQVLALSTGHRLRKLPESVAKATATQKEFTTRKIAPRHFDALMRILDREEPDYAA